MSDDFRYQCRRRSTPRCTPAEWPIADGVELLGAGSGGGETVYGSQTTYFQGKWVTCAGDVTLVAEDTNKAGTSLKEPDPVLELKAISTDGGTGRAYLRGDQGVRITSGLPNLPLIQNDAISGIEMQAGDEQSVEIMRGLAPYVSDELISLVKGSITIHEGSGSIHIAALQSIDISAGAGASCISLTPAGIVLRGPLIQIN
jgi:hypothetical protein